MTDMHVHLERGPYTKEWLNRECRLQEDAGKGVAEAVQLLDHSK